MTWWATSGGAAGVDGRGSGGASDRVRECGESAAGEGVGAAAGDGDSQFAGRGPAQHYRTDVDGEHVAGTARWRGRDGAGVWRAARPARADAGQYAAAGPGRAELAGGGAGAWALPRDGRVVCACARLGRFWVVNQ